MSLAAVVLWVEGLMAVMRYLESKGTLALCLMNWWKWALQTWLPTLQYSYGQQGSHPEPSGRWQILNHQIPCLFFPLKPALQVAKQRGEHRRIWERILRQWYHAKLRSEIILQYISHYFSKKRFSCRISQNSFLKKVCIDKIVICSRKWISFFFS